MYKERKIDVALREWSQRSAHKTLLLRGARQVGKTFAVRHLGEQFENFVEINFDKQGTKTLLLTHAKLEKL